MFGSAWVKIARRAIKATNHFVSVAYPVVVCVIEGTASIVQVRRRIEVAGEGNCAPRNVVEVTSSIVVEVNARAVAIETGFRIFTIRSVIQHGRLVKIAGCLIHAAVARSIFTRAITDVGCGVIVASVGLHAPANDGLAKRPHAFKRRRDRQGVVLNPGGEDLVIQGATEFAGCGDLHNQHPSAGIGVSIGRAIQHIPGRSWIGVDRQIRGSILGEKTLNIFAVFGK